VLLEREAATRVVSVPNGGTVRIIMTLGCPTEWAWAGWRASLYDGGTLGWSDFLAVHSHSFSLVDAVTLWDDVAPPGSLELAATSGPDVVRPGTTSVTILPPMAPSVSDPESRARLRTMSDLECMLLAVLHRWTAFWVRSRTGLAETEFGTDLRDFLLERRASRPCFELAQSYEERLERDRVGLFGRDSVHQLVELTNRWSRDVQTLLGGKTFWPSARTARFLSHYLIELDQTRRRLLHEGEGAVLFPTTGFLDEIVLDGQIFPIARLLADLFVDRFSRRDDVTLPGAAND